MQSFKKMEKKIRKKPETTKIVKETANLPEEYEKHCSDNKIKIWTFSSYLFLGLGDFFGRALLQIEGKPRITTLRQEI